MTAPIDYMPSLAKAGEARGGGCHVGRLHALFTVDIAGPGGAKKSAEKGKSIVRRPEGAKNGQHGYLSNGHFDSKQQNYYSA